MMRWRTAVGVMIVGLVWGTARAGEAAGGAEAGEVLQGERLDPSLYGPGVVESMEEVMQREELRASGDTVNPKARNGAHGQWVTPSRRSTFYPHSGERYVMNKWGDTEMGIGFPAVVDVAGAYFAGQGNHGAWASAVRAVGYREGEVVQTTPWLAGLSEKPKWLNMDFREVDRIVIEAKPVVEGAGWYGLDDLQYTPRQADGALGEPVVLDFEDLDFQYSLTSSGYAGLTWEFGTGDFAQVEIIHPPQAPPGADLPVAEEPGTGGLRAGLGTLPNLDDSFAAIRFGGGSGANSIPPDTCGAIGPNHFVSIVNSNLSAYLKAAPHTRVLNTSLSTFLPGSSGDPRILFDQHSGRWIVLVTDFNTKIYLAVSLTDDPTGSWFKTNFVVSSGVDANRWPDFPTLGVDANGIYTSAFMVNAGMSIFVIDKAPLIAASPSLGTVTAFRGLPYEMSMQPVHTYGNAGGEFYISTPGSPNLRIRKVTGSMTSPTLTTVATISAGTYGTPPDAPALGSSTNLDTGDSRFWHTPVYRDGFIWAAHTVSSNGRSAARWYKINTSPFAVADSGTVGDASLYFFYPHVGVNIAGDVALGMSGSNASQYAGTYYTGRRHDDPAGEMAVPVQYHAGVASYNVLDGSGRNRWGDYSATTLDPSDETTLWTIQEYTHATNTWGTYVAKLSFGDCNNNGILDTVEIAGDPGLDCQPDGILDECQLAGDDCNASGVPDECELVANDCNADLVPDDCQLAGNDCNANLNPDECDVTILQGMLSGPAVQNVCPSGAANFTVGGAPGGSTFQWFKGATPLADGGDISGATTDTLTISNVEAADAGAYHCEVNDNCIVASSTSANLTLIPTTLTITQQPVATVTICTSSGQGAAFQMSVDNTLAVSYQWFHDGVPVVNDGRITGATTNRLEIATVQTSDLGFYACRAENPCGASVDTDPTKGQLVVADAVYSEQPQDACAEVGGGATFSVTVASPPGVQLFWFRDAVQLSDGIDANGMVIAGATTSTLSLSNIPAVYDQSQFRVSGVFPSPLCISNSDSATLTVGGCPGCVVAGDMDDDGDVDLADMNAFVLCFGAAATPGGPCECADLAGPDGLVDLDDWAALAPLAGGPQ